MGFRLVKRPRNARCAARIPLQRRGACCRLESLLIEDDGALALIDGGIADNYGRNVQPYLAETVRAGGRLEVVVVSHIDADHITGILDLFADVERARADGERGPVKISDLWHNGLGAFTVAVTGIEAAMTPTGRVKAWVLDAGSSAN